MQCAAPDKLTSGKTSNLPVQNQCRQNKTGVIRKTYCYKMKLRNKQNYSRFELWHDQTNKRSVRPVKTQISPVWSESSQCTWWVAFFMWTAKTLIRLGGCPGCSESSLGTHSFCWFCHVVAHLFWCKITTNTDTKWAASWQNQQNDCAPIKDSVQPWYPPSLIRVFAVRSMGS